MIKFLLLLLIGVLSALFFALATILNDWITDFLFVLLVLVIAILSWFLLPTSVQIALGRRRLRFVNTIFICLLFLFFGGTAINYYMFPDMFHSVSLIADGVILLFTVFLGWGFLNPARTKLLGIGWFFFILVITSLWMVSPSTSTVGKSGGAEAIQSLPYLSMVPAGETFDLAGVTAYDASRTYGGLNLYAPWALPRADLIDMSGDTLQQWSARVNKGDTWYHVELADDGDIIVIVRNEKMGSQLIKVDRDSNIKWAKAIECHHDLAVTENKDICVLTDGQEIVFHHGVPLPILNNYIVQLSPEAAVKEQISLFHLLQNELPDDLFKGIYHRWKKRSGSGNPVLKTVIRILLKLIHRYDVAYYYDIIHSNTLEILDRDIEGVGKKGDFLICARELNLVAIINREKGEVRWSWGPGDLDKPHMPSLLDNGNILILDNGARRGYSRVVEVEPLTKKVVWEYTADPPESFFTEGRGGVQGLPNGNTLITESDTGRVFEITRGGDLVWEFYCPVRNPCKNERSSIYRMMRIIDPNQYQFLKDSYRGDGRIHAATSGF